MPNKWVDAKERLPHIETDTLLVALTNKDLCNRPFTDTDGFENDKFTYYGDAVQYWMYLPSPPEILKSTN